MEKKAETKILCFANNKGGSGKSTACANLGYELAAMGRRVLLVDGDMQLNLSLSFFDEETVLAMAGSGKTLYEAVRSRADLSGYAVQTPYPGLELIPSTTLMSQIELELFMMTQRELVLKKCLRSVKESGEYDYILIDAPPTLGMWVTNIICASGHVIIPVEPSPWGLFGLANMFEFLDSLEDISDAEVLGILISRLDERKSYGRQTREILTGREGIPVFESVIHVDASVGWSQDVAKPIREYKKRARSAEEFRKLAQEVERKWQ